MKSENKIQFEGGQRSLSTKIDSSSDSSVSGSNTNDDGKTKTIPLGRKIKKKISHVMEDAVVGTMQTFHIGDMEVRAERRQLNYEPTHHWWKPPLAAWVPEYNREILLVLFMYNALVPILAKFTAFCGEKSDDDVEIHTFCSDDFILLEDNALTGFAVGLFLLLAFRANQAYDRFWEGRKNWGRMREVSRDFTRLVCAHVQVENGKAQIEVSTDGVILVVVPQKKSF